LQSAWIQYGKDAFEFTIIEECSESVLIAREMAWMEYYDSMNREKGYNTMYPDRHTFTEEVRRRMGASKKGNQYWKGKHHSEETKKILSVAKMGNQHNKGNHCSEETRRKISEALVGNPKLMGRVKSEEHLRRLREVHKGNQYNKGRHPSEETKRKMSEAMMGVHKGKKLSEEHKMKLSLAHKGKKLSEEARKRLSERTILYWQRKHKEEKNL
jgi:hypothetical protein